MRIALVIDFFDERKGGAEAYLGAVARRLLAAGHAVELFARDWSALPAGVRGHRLRPRPLQRPLKRLLRPFTELAFARRAAARLRRAGHDVVLGIRNVLYATHYQPHGGARRAALRGIGEARGHPLLRAWYWCDPISAAKEAVFLSLERRLLTGPDAPRLLAVSRMVRGDFERLYGPLPGGSQVLYPGVDLASYHPGGHREDARWLRHHFAVAPGEVAILFAGHNPSLKGLPILLEAFAQACRDGLRGRLLVVGRFPTGPHSRRARELGIRDRVVFAGAVSRQDMPALYRGSDALVYPTFYDPCALVTLEALACGLPVITTRRNGAAELIREGQDGFVIDHPRDAAALAARLHLLEDEGARARMREAAAERGKDLDFDAHFERLLADLSRPAPAASGGAPLTARTVSR